MDVKNLGPVLLDPLSTTLGSPLGISWRDLWACSKICFPACFKLRPLPLATALVDARRDKASDAQRILADIKGGMDKKFFW